MQLYNWYISFLSVCQCQKPLSQRWDLNAPFVPQEVGAPPLGSTRLSSALKTSMDQSATEKTSREDPGFALTCYDFLEETKSIVKHLVYMRNYVYVQTCPLCLRRIQVNIRYIFLCFSILFSETMSFTENGAHQSGYWLLSGADLYLTTQPQCWSHRQVV